MVTVNGPTPPPVPVNSATPAFVQATSLAPSNQLAVASAVQVPLPPRLAPPDRFGSNWNVWAGAAAGRRPSSARASHERRRQDGADMESPRCESKGKPAASGRTVYQPFPE